MEESPNKGGVSENGNGEIDSELRTAETLSDGNTNGDDGVGDSGPMIKINVSHSSNQHQITLPAHSTFGNLKRVLARETGLEPKEQKLLFRGKVKDDDEFLHMVGVKDMSKVVLMEDAASKERKLEEMKRDQVISGALNSVALIRAEVDKLSQKASSLEAVMHGGTKVAEKEFVVLTELFMVQLLNLDSIEAEGEAKVQRRSEVRRVQNCVEALDKLKARNSNPFISSSNAVSTMTEWATFDSGVGSPNALPTLSSSCKITHDWEQFD